MSGAIGGIAGGFADVLGSAIRGVGDDYHAMLTQGTSAGPGEPRPTDPGEKSTHEVEPKAQTPVQLQAYDTSTPEPAGGMSVA